MTQRQFRRVGSRVRVETGALLWLLLLLVALLACKKSSDDESESTATSPSDDSSEDEGSTADKDEAEEQDEKADDEKADDEKADDEKADEPKEIAADKPSGGAAFSVGTPVDVAWGGSWWKAKVIAVKEGPKYKIHYVGWASSWDEWVGPKRIRPRTAGSRTK